MTNKLLLLLLSALIISCTNQESPKKFSLTFTTYNHAEQFLKGATIYRLDNNVLTIKKSYRYWLVDSSSVPKDTSVYSKTLENSFVEEIRKLPLDTLKDFYFNYCVMATSGTEYFISRKSDTVFKEISLHHYYQEQIEMLVDLLNKNIPENLKIDYLPKDTEQNCKP